MGATTNPVHNLYGYGHDLHCDAEGRLGLAAQHAQRAHRLGWRRWLPQDPVLLRTRVVCQRKRAHLAAAILPAGTSPDTQPLRTNFYRHHVRCAAALGSLGGADWAGQGHLYLSRPRDVAKSLYEHGEDLRRQGKKSSTTFDQLMTLEQAIHFVAGLLPAWEAWTKLPGVHVTTYEEFVNDTAGELGRICDFLGAPATNKAVDEVVERYRRRRSYDMDTHFKQGVVGRWIRSDDRRASAPV